MQQLLRDKSTHSCGNQTMKLSILAMSLGFSCDQMRVKKQNDQRNVE